MFCSCILRTETVECKCFLPFHVTFTEKLRESDLQLEVDRVVRVRLPLEDAVVAPRLVRLVRRLEDQPVGLVAQARLGELGAEQRPGWAVILCHIL